MRESVNVLSTVVVAPVGFLVKTVLIIKRGEDCGELADRRASAGGGFGPRGSKSRF